MNKLIRSTLVAAGLAAAAPLAFAQSTGDGPQPRHHAQRQQHEPRAFSLPSERIEARLAYLKTALKITEAQQPQWETFAKTLRKHAQDMDQRITARRAQMAQGQRDSRPTAIERLERRQARLAAAAARLNDMLVAATPLYAALTPEQQKVADEVLAAPRRGMRHGHRRGHA
jgi:chromosome segregation ATPase